MFNYTQTNTLLSALLLTQLMSAEVYAQFYHQTKGYEKKLWEEMLEHELEHIEFIKKLIHLTELPITLPIPEINIKKFDQICDRSYIKNLNSFILRLENSLRLEHAELNFGVEALAANELAYFNKTIQYPGKVIEHLRSLITYAKRYSASPNIGSQIIRLEEILPEVKNIQGD